MKYPETIFIHLIQITRQIRRRISWQEDRTKMIRYTGSGPRTINGCQDVKIAIRAVFEKSNVGRGSVILPQTTLLF